MEGTRWGYLHVRSYVGSRSGGSYYLCHCSLCGNTEAVISRRNLRGGTRSCGCLRGHVAKANLGRMQAGWRKWKAAKAKPVIVQQPTRYEPEAVPRRPQWSPYHHPTRLSDEQIQRRYGTRPGRFSY